MKSRIKATLAPIALAIFVCIGCQPSTEATASSSPIETMPPRPRVTKKTPGRSGPDVDSAPNGVLVISQATTAGNAFKNTLQNSDWTSSISPRGWTIVKFKDTKSSAGVEGGLIVTKEIQYPAIVTCINTLDLKEDMPPDAKANDYWRFHVVEYWIPTQETAHPERVEKITSCVVDSLNPPVSFQFAVLVDKRNVGQVIPSHRIP